jgi:hypothetical protein
MMEAFLRASAVRFTASETGRGCMIVIGALQCGPQMHTAWPKLQGLLVPKLWRNSLLFSMLRRRMATFREKPTTKH